MNMNKIFENEKINKSVFINVSEIPFDESFNEYCRKNMCGRYGTTWNCPPAVGDFEKCRNHALSFDKAFVFTHKGEITDYSDVVSMEALRVETLDILFDICEKLKKENIRFQPLGCGSCNVCEKCTYPDTPCRFPEKAVPSVEAYCVDVMKLAEKTGLVYYAGDNIVTFFCIIFFEELK